jgi:hypothetical protein
LAKFSEIDFKIKPAPYNARSMNKKTKERLKVSMQEFGDISGITINSRTGHILAGNHRWKQLEDTYGNLELKHIKDDMYDICKKNAGSVGYHARVVDWPLAKEKQANIVANASVVQGDFTSEIQEQLKEIDDELESALMDDLGLYDMMLEVPENEDDKDLDMDESQTDLKRRKTIEDLQDEDEPSASPVKEIISSVKITAPAEHKEEILEIVMKALSKKPYYDELVIS